MAMSATEIHGWMEYYSVYPFPQDREDFRMAKICEVLTQAAKGYSAQFGSWKFFMPDYLGELDLQAIIDQHDLAVEDAWANYLDAQERADNGNQTSGT